MLTISKTISKVKPKLALVPFITAGYPDIQASVKIIQLLDENGANAIEIGIPYSDALADGIVIQESSLAALNQDIYIDQVLELLKQTSSLIKAPIILFTYFNPILSRGLHNFIKEISRAGAKGLIIPDLPLEESDHIIALCGYYHIELILFISPASSNDRIKTIISKAPGALYLVSSYGVTGLRSKIPDNLINLAMKIKEKTDKCIMLGFGISDAKQVTQLIHLNLDIDAVVMGTAFINQIKSSLILSDYQRVKVFCKSIKSAIDEN